MAALNKASIGVRLRDESGAAGLRLEAMEDEGEVTVFIKHAGKQYFVSGPSEWGGKEVVVFMQRLAFYACAVGADGEISAPIPFEAMGAHRAAGRFPSVVKVASGGLHAAQSMMKEQQPINDAGKHWLASAQVERNALSVGNHTGLDALTIQTLRTKEGALALLLVHKGEAYTCTVPLGWGRGQASLVVFLMRLTFHMCRTDTLETREFEALTASDIPLGWTADGAGMAKHASMAPLARRSSIGLHAHQSLLKKARARAGVRCRAQPAAVLPPLAPARRCAGSRSAHCAPMPRLPTHPPTHPPHPGTGGRRGAPERQPEHADEGCRAHQIGPAAHVGT